MKLSKEEFEDVEKSIIQLGRWAQILPLQDLLDDVLVTCNEQGVTQETYRRMTALYYAAGALAMFGRRYKEFELATLADINKDIQAEFNKSIASGEVLEDTSRFDDPEVNLGKPTNDVRPDQADA